MDFDLPRNMVTQPIGNGLLRAEHFQIAYATNDIDRACELFRSQLGITKFRRLEGPLPDGGMIRVELAWAGPVMYELLSASGPGSSIYMDRLPQQPGFAIRHHHLGYLLPGIDAWDALMAAAMSANMPVPHQNTNPGFLRSCFVDAKPFGHYLEYILPDSAGREFLLSVPQN